MHNPEGRRAHTACPGPRTSQSGHTLAPRRTRHPWACQERIGLRARRTARAPGTRPRAGSRRPRSLHSSPREWCIGPKRRIGRPNAGKPRDSRRFECRQAHPRSRAQCPRPSWRWEPLVLALGGSHTAGRACIGRCSCTRRSLGNLHRLPPDILRRGASTHHRSGNSWNCDSLRRSRPRTTPCPASNVPTHGTPTKLGNRLPSAPRNDLSRACIGRSSSNSGSAGSQPLCVVRSRLP